jgi:sodium transport system permease protein
MSHVLTIFRKELTDVLRDKRTVFAMILAPVLIYPLFITGFSQVMKSQSEKAKTRELRVGVIGDYVPAAFSAVLEATGPYRLQTDLFGGREAGSAPDTSAVSELLQDSLDLVLGFGPDFETRLDSLRQASMTLYYRSTQEASSGRIEAIAAAYSGSLEQQRLARLGLDPTLLKPLAVERVDISSTREMLGLSLGAMLPYMFLIFCFLGCMYPAIDLGAGEKERGTMETLLSSPASRLDIFLGKFGVVALGGIISAVLALVSLGASLQMNMSSFGELPPEVMESLSSIAEAKTVLLLLLLLLPTTVFFASGLMTLSISAQSFKEAQSLISPMMIVVLLPSVVAFVPGMELNTTNAWIPIFNVSLAARDILAGTLETGPFVISVVSLVALAGLGMLLSLRFYASEKNVLPSG